MTWEGDTLTIKEAEKAIEWYSIQISTVPFYGLENVWNNITCHISIKINSDRFNNTPA